MTTIVFAALDALSQLSEQMWCDASTESYVETQRAAERTRLPLLLIGRRDSAGLVSVRSAQYGENGWRDINTFHLTLARYFLARLARTGATCFNDSEAIGDAAALNAARQLIAAECGVNTPFEPWTTVHRAINTVNAALGALGVATGDWTFVPLCYAYEAMRSEKFARTRYSLSTDGIFTTDNTDGTFTAADLRILNDAATRLIAQGLTEKEASDCLTNGWVGDGEDTADRLVRALRGAEIVALESEFARLTGETFVGRDALFIELSGSLEETGNCEIPRHLTLSRRPELIDRRDLRVA